MNTLNDCQYRQNKNTVNKCSFCNNDSVEDVEHFLLDCCKFNNLACEGSLSLLSYQNSYPC